MTDDLLKLAERAPFSLRMAIGDAIEDPASFVDRLESKDGLHEAHSHWQARATLKAISNSGYVITRATTNKEG